MNMPFELGVDFGCRKYGKNDEVCSKKFLVIGSQHYDYMKALSDISGIDIQYHEDKEDNLIKSIRHWFVNNELQGPLVAADTICETRIRVEFDPAFRGRSK